MGAFELQDTEAMQVECGERPDPRRIREECIIAFKVYDSCRHQDCLTPSEIGPARAAECITIGDIIHREGDIIKPPENAATVTIDHLRVKKIVIVDKQPSPFRNGYWDIDIKYAFEYRLTFRESDVSVINSIKASNVFNLKISLFGSTGSDLVIGTDLLNALCDSATFEAEPFILVEAKAVALNAKLHYTRRHEPCMDERFSTEPNEVLVTIGLFSIIKLFRIVNLTVESKGFCIPDECNEISPISPCEYFEELDFPMDIFAPPQKPEFLSGVSSNIPNKKRK